MSWTPKLTVTIAGTDFTGETVDEVQLRRGRQTVYQNVQAAVASIQLLDVDGTGIVPTVADPVTVKLEDTTGNDVTLFVGEVSDFSTRIYDAGIRNQPAAQIRVTAVSNLAKIQRRQVFPDGRPVEKDGERVFDILLDALGLAWEDLQGTWDDLGDATWETIDPGIDFNIVDTPGLFDIVALDPRPEGYEAGSIAGEAGLSTGGLLYETADGRIGYADGLRRRQNANEGYKQIPAQVLQANQIATTSQLADLANVVVVRYDGGEVTLTDVESINQFGRLVQRLQTELVEEAEATLFAENYLDAHAQPQINFDAATVRLEQDLPAGLRDTLLGLEVNDALEIDGLPPTLGLTTFAGFLEGVTITIDPFRVSYELTVSAANLSIGPLFWAALPAIAWQDLPADLQWQNFGSLQ